MLLRVSSRQHLLWLSAVLLFTGLLAPWPVFALRCGNQVIDAGDPQYRVRAACGPPDYVDRLYGAYADPETPRETLWYYNFGDNQFVRELHFRNGRLQAIETTDYGFRKPPASPACRPVEIVPGMTSYALRALCGPPIQRQQGRELHRVERDGVTYGYNYAWIEDWYYDFGSQYFDRRIRLVDGRVTGVFIVD